MKFTLSTVVASLFGTGVAFATTTAPTAVINMSGNSPSVSAQPSNLPSLVMLVVFVLIFYFMLIRPQMKRSKEQRQVMSNLEKGDEVVTTSGVYGKIVSVESNSVEIEIADKVVVKMQKQAVMNLVPKGTLSRVEGA